MSTPHELLQSLARAFGLTLERDPRTPDLLQALEDVRSIHDDLGWVVVQLEPAGFRTGGVLVPAGHGDVERLRHALGEAGILEMRLQGVMEPEVLEDFLRRLHPSTSSEPPLPSVRFRGLETEIGLSFRKSPQTPLGMSGSIERMFDFDKPPVPELPVVADEHPMDPTPVQGPSSSTPLVAPGLEEEVWALLGDMGPSRGERLASLAERVGVLKEARDLPALSSLVLFLVEASGEAAENDDVLALARDLVSPAVASHLVARLGAERAEAERDRLTRDVARLGREVALALADALGEARDRFQRRSFMDALVAMGSLGMEMAQGMVLDPRWFVVRNGVAILGDLGGDGAVAPITSTLSHSDHRVRRESVLALAKLGGDEAVQLLLGMIDDPEADVRAAACRALGALKAEKALRPLLTLLETEKDEDVQVECLKSLGQLGDSGAVPLLEKKAVGGLFSRTSREVRIAAYRALAGIGTPRAKALLEKAAQESDVGIRTVARALLDQT